MTKSREMEYEVFIKKVSQITGIDLKNYKRHQLERRIRSLMRAQGVESYLDYLVLLKRDSFQLKKLVDHLTINVSEFYRNPLQWKILKEEILPELLKTNPCLRTWSAGCATGEEPYTLALVLKEKIRNPFPKILATDVDEDALAKAREGVYPERAVVNVPRDQLRKYFEKEGDKYRISEEIKNLVEFRRHDLLRDPFRRNFDLILCRNVVIYFTEEAKNNLYRRFRNALRPGGILFTGSTEQIFRASELGLEAVASFFYRRV
ncbi:MAG: Chemotaxis protein methyltransferase CheR [Thermoanaerobacterales bacterium 50_218]|nr:MAG: Chemotaxis protein methyltransferase CheR [Thermoanaerobacterales bacterium 50_218]